MPRAVVIMSQMI